VLEEELTAREEANRTLRNQLASRDDEIASLRAQVVALQAQIDAQNKAGECKHCQSAETAINSWLAAKRERGVLTERSGRGNASARSNRHPRKSL
jgi:hypothetical protein